MPAKPKLAAVAPTQYLGSTRPLLHVAVERIWETRPRANQSDKKIWDLSGLLMVLPTARSRRRILELLHEQAGREQVNLIRPVAITIGELPARLFKSKFKLATELEQTLAWAQALTSTPEAQLTALISNVPPREPLTPWLDLAATIQSLHEDLAAGEISFENVQAEVDGDAEQRRWQLLSELHQRYLKRLHEAERADPYVARTVAIANGLCSCEKEILLIGTSDLSRSLLSLLRSLPKQSRVTAYVAADESLRDHFDPYGSIITSRWLLRELPLRDDQLIAAQDVADQAAKAVAEVASWKRLPASGMLFDLNEDEKQAVTIGVTDESFVGPIDFELRTGNLNAYREIGWTIIQTPAGRLLQRLSDHLTQNSWRSLAALVRHADMFEFINRKIAGDWLTSLDNLIANHYPTRCDHQLAERAVKDCVLAIEVKELVQLSVRELRGSSRTLSDWSGRIASWLSEITGCSNTPELATLDSIDQNDETRVAKAWAATINYLTTVQSLESQLDIKVPASAALEMLLSRLSSVRVSDSHSDNDVTIAGWLDLALDDAMSMVIVSLNQPYVPESVTADPFLPGSLRTRLQLNDNERRFARDIHAMEVILTSRPNVKIVVGTRSLDGSPTPPSRLLAAAKPIDTAHRLVNLLEPKKVLPISPTSTPWTGNLVKSNLPIPVLPIDKPVTRMSVTAFKDYLTCPYRFYLRHVLYLRPLDDASGELQANQFGDLVHNTLDWFGCSKHKDSTSVTDIETALHETLDEYAYDFFGEFPNAAVRLQIEQARRRLSNVAVVQAKRRADGWKIHSVETPFGEGQNAGVDVDGSRMLIRGRIDRIDHHENGRWAIIDYKTHGFHPRKKHLQKVGDETVWLDLQLPLYQLLIPFVIGERVQDSDVSLSYFNIGDNASQTKINDADFTPEEFSLAREQIDICVRRIRQGDFAPATEVPFDDYSMILQTGAVASLIQALGTDELELANVGAGEGE